MLLLKRTCQVDAHSANLTDSMGDEGIAQLALGALYRLHVSCSAGPDQVLFDSCGRGRALALFKFKPRHLVVMP